ncbi:hypothetical protein RHO14_09740 [Orbus wheelerorum]|uniref:hypothetical protein n=1 Tax=Orbus wheelerorum TaxID=3074111 RepID=UPI00370D64A6
MGNGSYAAETKDSKQWGFTFLDLSNSVYSELGNKAAISVNIGMTKLTKAYRDEWQSLLKDPTKKGYGAEQARGAFLNSISLYLTFEGLNNDLAELEQAKDEQYGQHYKDRLIDSIQKAQVTFAAQTILALNSGLNLLTKGSRIVAYLAQGKSGLQMINQILKGGVASSSAALSLAASGVLGVMSILESIETFKSAKQLIDDGEYWTGKLLQVGAVVQGVIGVILLLQTFKIIPLSGLWAIGFMLGAALIALLVYIFRDKTQDWIPIEVWANRILFGNNEKPKKWPTYPPTVLGTGIATNDYLAAVQGLNCNIEFGQQHESAYINRLGALSDNQAELDREYNKFYTSMESTMDYQTRSRLEDDWYRYLENKLNLERSYLEGIHKAAWLNSGLRGDESNQYLTLAQNRAKAEAQERERSILKSKLKADAFYHTQGLYIQMTLPKYDQKISRLEAFLHISQGDKTMILSIVNGKDYPEINVLSGELSSVVLRVEYKKPVINRKESNSVGVTKDESYDVIKRPKTKLETGLPMLVINPDSGQPVPILEDTDTYKITYKVAEIYGAHNIYLNVNYWQDGKTKIIKSQTGEQKSISLAPLVQVYNYQKD